MATAKFVNSAFIEIFTITSVVKQVGWEAEVVDESTRWVHSNNLVNKALGGGIIVSQTAEGQLRGIQV